MFFFFFAVATQVTAMVWSSVELWRTHHRATFYLFGFQFLQVTLKLQYAHILYEQVNPFRRTVVLVWILQWINILSLMQSGTPYFDEVNLLWFCLGIQFLAIAHQVYYSYKEMMEILDINMFTIKRKKV